MAKIIIQFEPVSNARLGFLFDDILKAINESEWKPDNVTVVTEETLQEVS